MNLHVPAGLPSPTDELSLKSCVIAIPMKEKAKTANNPRLAGMSTIEVYIWDDDVRTDRSKCKRSPQPS